MNIDFQNNVVSLPAYTEKSKMLAEAVARHLNVGIVFLEKSAIDCDDSIKLLGNYAKIGGVNQNRFKPTTPYKTF